MSPEKLLLRHFELMSDSPEAISRLRQFILDLAVRGKLSENTGLVRVDAPRFPGTAAQPISTSISIPESWKLRFLGEICAHITDGEHATPPRILDHEVPLVTAKNVRNGAMDYTDTDWVSRTTAAKAWQRCCPQPRDILMVCVGATTGRLCVLTEQKEMVLVRSVALLRPSTLILPEFLALCLRSPFCQSQIWKSVKVAAQPCLYINRIKTLRVPLPPLNAQKQIVRRVGGLMALCDELEVAQEKREGWRDQLVMATLHGLNNGEDSAESGEAMSIQETARFYFNHLPRLTTRPEHVQQIRRTILNLAVLGRLVKQDLNDKSAGELIRFIENDVASAIKTKKMKMRGMIASFEGELPSLPDRWQWSQLGLLTAAEDNAMCDGPFGSNLKTEHYIHAPGFAVIRLGNIGSGQFIWGKEGYITGEHYHALSRNHVHPGDLIVAGLGDPLLRCCHVPPELGPAVNKADCFRVRLSPRIDANYVCYYLNSPVANAFAAQENHGMTRGRINLSGAKTLPVPIPPAKEQTRIASRVSELMALCDALENRLDDSIRKRQSLLESVLREALEQPNVADAAFG